MPSEKKMSLLVIKSILAIWSLIFISITLTKEILYYLVNHSKGTIKYILLTVAVTTITLPITTAFLLFLIPIQIYYKLFKAKAPKISYSKKTSKNIFYLVHGTFGQDASWVFEENSKLKNSIKNQFRGDVDFCNLSWSGRNSQEERAKAADMLATEIRENNKNNLQQYIICHSHGGNIVLDAIGKLGGREVKNIKKIAFLSVPVINFLKRPDFKFVEISYFIAASLVLLWPVLIYFILNPSTTPFFYLIVFISSIIFAFLLKRYRRRKITEITNEFESHLQANKRIKTFSKFYNCIGDEAHIALELPSNLAELSSGISNQAAEALEKRMQSTKNRGGRLYMALSAIYFFLALIGAQNSTDTFYIIIILVISTLFLISATENSIAENTVNHINLLPSIAFFLSNTLAAMAFGNPKYLLQSGYSIFPSKTPIGTWSIHTEPKNYNNLAHSTHSHDETIKNITRWVSK